MRHRASRIAAAVLVGLVLVTLGWQTPILSSETRVRAQGASLADYYLDAVLGDDATGDGSAQNPWRTFAKALSSIPDGSRLHVRSGVYHESPLVTSLSGLTIVAEPGGPRPVVTTAALLGADAWTPAPGYGAVYQTTYSRNALYGVWQEATPLTPVAGAAECDVVENSYFWDSASAVLYVHVAGGGAPADIHAVHDPLSALTMKGTGCTLKDITFYWLFQAVEAPAGRTTIRGCTVGRMTMPYNYSALRLGGARNLVDGCTLTGADAHRGYGVDLMAGSSGAVIQNSAISTFRYGIQALSGSKHVIRGNAISDCFNGLYLDSAGGQILHNTLVDCTHGAMEAVGRADLTLAYNLFYFTHDVGYDGQHGWILHTNGSAYLYHNLVGWLDRGTQGYGEAFYLTPISGKLRVVMRNNVATHCTYGIASQQGQVTLNLDYNGFFGNGADFYNVPSNRQGTHNVTVDPRFVDPGNGDFHLLLDSPYIDAGVYVAGINDGYLGLAPDIGPYETR